MGTLQANGKAAGSATQQDAECGMLVVHGTQDPCVSDKAFALGRNNGQENAVLAFSCKDYGGDATAELSPTLRAMGHDGSHANVGGQVAIALIQNATRGKDQNGLGIVAGGEPMYTLDQASQHAVCVTGDITHTLKADGFDGSEDGTGRGQPIVVAFHENQRGELTTNDTAGTVKCSGGKPGQGYPAAMVGSAVRRLTPVECERLQGFPDNYTLIPWDGWRKLDAGETPEQCIADGMKVRQAKKSKAWYVCDADGPRYKAIGNSKAVPVVRWIGRRIQQQLESM